MCNGGGQLDRESGWARSSGHASTRHIGGLRVTDAETLDVVRMVLVGKVNRDIVGALNAHGPIAVGVSGEGPADDAACADAGIVAAGLRPAPAPRQGAGQP